MATFLSPQGGCYREVQLYTVFSPKIAAGDYFFFRTKRGRLFEGGDYFKYCPKYFVLFSH